MLLHGDSDMRICFVAIALAVSGMLNSRTAVQAQSYGASSPYGGGGFAQSYSGMSGQQGIFGTRTLGSNLSPGQRSFGGQSFGAQGGGGLSPSFGMNRQPGDFVGVDPQNQQRFVGAPPMANNPGFGGFNPQTMSPGGGGQNYPGRRPGTDNREHSEQQTASPIRTTLCAAFEYAKPDSAKLSSSLTQRLAEMSALHTQTPIQVKVRGRTAILQGVATTEHDRALAEQLIRLEAGIEEVKNEIAVASPMSPKSDTP
jgi:hypothetical protein